MQLIWFRNDLRVHDNTALLTAMQEGPTLALFLLSPGQWRTHDDASAKVDFQLRNLRVLADELEQLNVPLLVRTADTWDGAPTVLTELCREHRIRGVHVNEEYGVNETARDRSVARQLAEQKVGFNPHLDQLLFRPGTLLTRAGSYFKVFSQFRKACLQQLSLAPPRCLPLPQPQKPIGIHSDPIPASVTGFATPDETLRAHWPAGEQAARQRLQLFADDHLHEYDEQRDLPAEPGTSQLSPYLTTGVLSPRQCLHAALMINQGELDSGNTGVTTWINELLWREFYKHILVGYPRVSRHRAFRSHTEAVPWRDAPEELLAWQQGRTGFPLIDAAMRQLLATGWMHNRLRMVVAMFLSKNLLIDWRQGERFFMQHLIDGDLAANNGGWQWSSSTGTDAVPWFRLFNPITQSQRFDPQGRFIKHWLPELGELDRRDIHDPSPISRAICGYPAPIIDLADSRARALAAFRNLPPPGSDLD
ncbi:deoxyribodipyrimidine photo-lyase type I [Halopseudomonas litoralis]|uniref:Deoxyribodipyrimidine photo-lyase n=1 Tax=Halopseudomonas litoralis TaxID=797277 RepID=A0A1H1WGJ6_9GAMM|nr:deoxyribodipyrimidine photo-lyase [Halopseudomonas litoralis]SDS96214.1 deoxyribodipyrimidine photo-lyase type I [Halopseudomonas litoralis]